MRLPEERIKAGIRHPEEEVRLTAVEYFTNSYSPDPAIMPLVVEAVEKYGRANGFRLLRHAEGLEQTSATLDWLMAELEREYDGGDIEQDNYRFAVAVLLCRADPELLVPRHRQIVKLPGFPEQLRVPLSERMKLYFQNWPPLWEALETWGKGKMQVSEITSADSRRLDRIVEALARHPNEGSETVMSLLNRHYKGYNKALMQWLEPQIVDLAGRMHLNDAIPLIFERLEEDDEGVMDQISDALSRIGGDAVVDAVSEKWDSVFPDSQFLLAETLEHIHTDRAFEHLLAYLEEADDPDLEVFIAYCAISHLSPDAMAPVRHRLVDVPEREMDGDEWDLRYRLIAAATLMGERFPEYGPWHAEAVKTNYGWRKIGNAKPKRLADAFADDR